MAATGTALRAGEMFQFAKDGKFLENQIGVGVAIEAPKDSALAAALLNNTVFPAGITRIGTLSVKLEGDTGAVKFGGGSQGVVSFKGSGGFRTGLGVYDSASGLLADLDPQNKILAGLVLPDRGVARFVALNWSYDIHAAVKGSVALGNGVSIKFGAEGATDGFFAVIRGFAEDPASRDAIQQTITTWKLPRQVQSVADLEPGAWLVAEVDGEIGVKLGAQFGYDYNWIRAVNLGPLSGDIGLKIQAAVDATVGFSAAGKYLLIVGRESLNADDKVVRLRLFKMAKKGWDFALNASVGVTGNTGKFLPGQLDDFVAAVFGVHGAQVVEDLKAFRQWTDPNTPLPDLFAGFVSRLAANQLVEGRKRVAGFLEQWGNLDHSVSSVLWSEIRKGGPDAQTFEEVLRAMAATDDEGLKGLIANALSEAEFFRSPVGKFLESIVAGSVLTAVGNVAEIQEIRKAAQAAISILDGKVLHDLIQYVDEKLDIKLVKDSLDNLEPWLKDKLSKFLGKNLDLAGLEEVRKALRVILDKADQLYTTAVGALNKKYSASFNYTFASSTTKTALVDVSFDFAQDAGLGAFLTNALNGNLNDLLLQSREGVTLHEARLTRQIARNSHVEVNLPYFNSTIEEITKSLAGMTVIEDKGRLFIYDLKASDDLTARLRWQSTLAVTGKITVGAGSSVRTFVTDKQLANSMTYSYNFRAAFPKMRSLQLEHQVRALVQPYFQRSFGGPLAPEKASLQEWIADLDKHADAVESNGTGNLGNTLLSLEVSLPGAVAAAWLQAPESQQDRTPYMNMSRNIQRALRMLVPYCYFQQPERYVAAELPVAASVMVYECLPVSTSISLRDGEMVLDQNRDLTWDYESTDQRQAMIFNRLTENRLRIEMARVRALLTDIEDFRGFADDYDPESVDRLRNLALHPSGPDFLTKSLLFIEAEAIRRAHEAGLAIVGFRGDAGTKPEKALEELANFGSEVTRAFNSGLGDLFGGETLRELGALVFIEAARAFDSALGAIEPSARLDVTILRNSAPATWREDFLAGKIPERTVVALEQPVVSLPAEKV